MKTKMWWQRKWLQWGGLGLLFWGIPGMTFAQYGVFEQDSLGYGLWLSLIQINIDPAVDSASNRVKGFTEVLPSSLTGVGIGGGGNWKNFGFDLGASQADVSIQKLADVQQNEDPRDDLFVTRARRSNQSWSILHHPFPYFYYGYGGNQGRFEFRVTVPDGGLQWRRVGFSHTYYLLGIVYSLQWDPPPNPLYLLFTLFAKIPLKQASFSGNIYGIGITGAIP